MKGPKDPVDHTRTTRPHAGESMKDNVIMPALVLIGVALAMLSAAGMLIGALWLALEHVRVRRIEERWYAAHPEAIRQRPNS